MVHPANWLHSFSAGLSAVAVALVADAAYNLSKKLCNSRVTVFCCAISAGVTYYYASQWIFPTLIAVGEAPFTNADANVGTMLFLERTRLIRTLMHTVSSTVLVEPSTSEQGRGLVI